MSDKNILNLKMCLGPVKERIWKLNMQNENDAKYFQRFDETAGKSLGYHVYS